MILHSSFIFFMLDRKFIVENAELVKKNCALRGARADVDRFLELEGRRREKQNEVDELNRQANEVSKSIGQTKDPAERDARKNKGRELREQTTAAQAALEMIV